MRSIDRFGTPVGIVTLAAISSACAPALSRSAASVAWPIPALRGESLPPNMLLLDADRSGSRIVAAGEHGIVVWSDDAGHRWRRADVPTREMLTGITFAGGEARGWAVGHGGVVLRSDDGGASWVRVGVPAGREDSFLDVLALARDHVLAVGAYGLFLETTDGAGRWERRTVVGEDLHLNRVSSVRSGNLFLAGERGLLARSTDQGRSWQRLETHYEGSFYGVLELETGHLAAHGLRGHVFISDDDGSHWRDQEMVRPLLLMAGAALGPNAFAVGGLGGVVYVTLDGGASFAGIACTRLKSCAEFVATASGTLLAFGEGGAEEIALDPPDPRGPRRR